MRNHPRGEMVSFHSEQSQKGELSKAKPAGLCNATRRSRRLVDGGGCEVAECGCLQTRMPGLFRIAELQIATRRNLARPGENERLEKSCEFKVAKTVAERECTGRSDKAQRLAMKGGAELRMGGGGFGGGAGLGSRLQEVGKMGGRGGRRYLYSPRSQSRAWHASRERQGLVPQAREWAGMPALAGIALAFVRFC
jgi:hypothetical protein